MKAIFVIKTYSTVIDIDCQSFKTPGIKVNYLYACERKLWPTSLELKLKIVRRDFVEFLKREVLFL